MLPCTPIARALACAVLLTPLVPIPTSAAIVPAGEDWATYLGDAGATQYSTLAQIDRTNVGRLQVAWVFRSGGADPKDRSQIQCNPLVIDGVLYGTSPRLALFALDAASGRELWRFDPFGSDGDRMGGVNRGLTLWREGGERRLLFAAASFLFAIDPATGRAFPDFGRDGRVDLREDLDRDARDLSYVSNTPGAVYRDLIIVTSRVGEGPGPAAPGHIRAFDVRTGERRWIFHTIPHPGEEGHETWPPDAWQHIGGANCWAGLTVDAERGTVFVPTGSAAFDFWGGNRIGQNLFANCLLALDAATGRRKWHFQFVHHDLWDRDPPAAPVLAEITRDGARVPVVVQTTKSGHVWVFHRDTGESLFPWREAPAPASSLAGEVAWPTQPEPGRPAPFARQLFTEDEVTNLSPESHAAVLARLRSASPHRVFDPPGERGTIILPGFDGGAEWGGAAVAPDGVLYVNSNEMAWILTMVPAGWSGTETDAATIYRQLCMVCHGPERLGNPAQNVPSLAGIGARLQAADIATVLQTGRAAMPSFAFLNEAQRTALAEFLLVEAPLPPAPAAASVDARAAAPVGPSAPAVPWTTTGYNRFLDPEGYPALKPPWGTLNAIDLNTGDYVWTVPLGERAELTARGLPPTGTENYGGPVVTAGGLVFIAATNDEKLRAFDCATGEKLWEATLPAGGYATPATYAVGGRQYVVIACGGGKMGTSSGDAYVAFALPQTGGSTAP